MSFSKIYILFIVDDVLPEQFQLFDIDEFDDYNDTHNLRLSCFLHSLQLCVRDGVGKTTFTSRALEKCRALAKFSRRSSKMAERLEQLAKSVSKSNITRWNSDYLLVKSIVSIGKTDLDSIVSLMEKPVKFTTNEINMLKELIDVLEPFYDITITCQSETVVTASLVVPAVVHLLIHLCENKNSLSFCEKLVRDLHLSVEKRFAGIVKRLNHSKIEDDDPFNDPAYFLATMLDPSFKFLWIPGLKLTPNNENKLKQHLIQLLLDEINKDCNNLPPHVSDENNVPIRSKKRKLFAYEDPRSDGENTTFVINPVTEVNAYFNDPVRSQFSSYWRGSQFHRLKKLAKCVCSIQASSAPVERVFSHAGLIFSPRRTRLNEELFTDLVFLKVNQAFL